MVTLDSVIGDIQRRWAWVVSPRADRTLDDWAWDAPLAREFAGSTIWNLGDGFNYSKCYTYGIPLYAGSHRYPESLTEERQLISAAGGALDILLLKLSVVAPYYIVKLVRRTVGSGGQIEESEVIADDSKHIEFVGRARQFAVTRGFAEIPSSMLNAVVPGAELDLAPVGQVTVYNCLFEDEYPVS